MDNLYSSARAFPHPEELARMFRQAALVETSCHNLAGGNRGGRRRQEADSIARLLSGTKNSHGSGFISTLLLISLRKPSQFHLTLLYYIGI
jgi:hypothetical protein